MAIEVNGKKKLTYDDLLLFPDDGKRHELIDGEHFVSASPETYHQKLSMRIAFQLFGQIEVPGKGEVFPAPTDLKFSEIDVVVPDILVVLAPRLRIITSKLIQGAPDLVVEILSPSTKARDRRNKLALFQKAGVPEYWIVDPVKRVVERYVLEGGVYRLAGEHSEEILFGGLPGVVVDLRKVW